MLQLFGSSSKLWAERAYKCAILRFFCFEYFIYFLFFMWCQLYFLGSFFLIFLILDDCFGFFDHFSFGALPDTFYVIFHVFGLSKDFL